MTRKSRPNPGRQTVKQVIKQSQKMVVPTIRHQARAEKIATAIKKQVQREAEKHPEIKSVKFGGSFIKDTWIARPQMDIDIYLVFAHDIDEKRFREVGIDVGQAALKDYSPYQKFSEHPYVEAVLQKGILVNIVPCYEIIEPGKWKSAADRSQLHTDYITKQFDKKKRDETRLLKAFLHANGLYGAEIAKNGFSGYVSEVLIDHFKSFEHTIKTFADIKPRHTIGNAKQEFGGMVVITDLIDGNRNLAAAISDENMVRFILACRAFLKNPSVEFFDKKHMKKNKKNTYWNHMLVIKFGYKKRSPDMIWGQTKKSATKLVKYLRRYGFSILRYNTHIDLEKRRGYIFVLLDAVAIPSVYQQHGPGFYRRKNLDAYIKKSFEDQSEMMWVDPQGRLVALKKRTYATADVYARHLLQDSTGLLPAGQATLPKVWIGKKDLSRAAKEAAEELISTDAAIVHLS